MLFSSCHESYVPQKLFHRRKFLRHKYNKSGVVTAINIYTHPSNSFGNEDSWRPFLVDYTDLICDWSTVPSWVICALKVISKVKVLKAQMTPDLNWGQETTRTSFIPESIPQLYALSFNISISPSLSFYLAISLNSFSILNSQFILFFSFSLCKKNLSHYLAKFILHSQFSIYSLSLFFSFSLCKKKSISLSR